MGFMFFVFHLVCMNGQTVMINMRVLTKVLQLQDEVGLFAICTLQRDVAALLDGRPKLQHTEAQCRGRRPAVLPAGCCAAGRPLAAQVGEGALLHMRSSPALEEHVRDVATPEQAPRAPYQCLL